MSNPSCPVCSSTETQELCQVGAYAIRRCARCATDHVFPAPSEQQLRAYYDRAEWFEAGEKGGYQNYDTQSAHALPLLESVLDTFSGTGRSVLDVGCGYGNHLKVAHDRGWKCFGVEMSSHARQVITQRHGDKFFVADQVEHMIPHAFDLILMLDVLEHVSDPYALLYALFGKGAITPATLVVISTPNARSSEAVRKPAEWTYRHPPSHLTYFSAQSLLVMLQRLHFASVAVEGQHLAVAEAPSASYNDEPFAINQDLIHHAGLVCRATGSDFAHFMQERYVPGTWSKLAEYEHLPRYLWARDVVAGHRVLDFGCGVGYGSALLAERAEQVTALDIDTKALNWARERHGRKNLKFEHNENLGASLPAGAFEAITCFEMIEHVDGPVQVSLMEQFARLLAPQGFLLISTPNPDVTQLYGDNPYHKHELTRSGFAELLAKHFSHVLWFEQHIQPAIQISPEGQRAVSTIRPLQWHASDRAVEHPAVFIALCSHAPVPPPLGVTFMDGRSDLIATQTDVESRLAAAQFAHVRAAEAAQQAIGTQHALGVQAQQLSERLTACEALLHVRNVQTQELEATLHQRNLDVRERDQRLLVMQEQFVHMLAERDHRLLDLGEQLDRARAELMRYRWIRKIDRVLFRYVP